MTTAYVPQSGSIAARALAHLQSLPAGTEMASGPLADALGVHSSMMNVCLDTASKHGVLWREKREGRIYWRLGKPVQAAAPPPLHVDLDEDPDENAEPIARTVPAGAAAPLVGLMRQSWCPAAQATGDESSLDELPTPLPSPPAPPLGLGWKAPRTPVFLADAPTLAAAPEPAGAARAPDFLTPYERPLTADEQDLAVDVIADPDFQEVRRAPALTELDTPPKGAEAAQAPATPPCGRDDATPNDGVVPQESEFSCALWSNGVFEIVTSEGGELKLKPDDARNLVRYVSEVLSARARAAA